jgi:hypothetical protein
VRPGALKAASVSEGTTPPRPPSWPRLARVWLAFAVVVLTVAGAVSMVAPDWLAGGERELPDRPSLIVDIFVNNLLLALVPLIGGWLAAGHLLAGRGAVAAACLLVAAPVVARSLGTIGAVGGADPAWLADAARWWLLEVAALAVATDTGIWLARNPAQRDRRGAEALRRALAVITGTLAVGALVEVLSA